MQSTAHPEDEPEIDEILNDPVMLALLKRDGLTVEDIRQVIASYRENMPSH